MTQAQGRRRGAWRAALVLAAGIGPAVVLPSYADVGLGGPVRLGESRPEIQRLVVTEAVRNGVVPAPLALAVAEVSSDFVPRTIGSSGAVGIMQLEPAVAESEFGATAGSLWNPANNVRLGLRYLSRLHRRYGGDWELALSHFRGGALHWMDGAYRPHDYTRDWLQRVMYHWRYYQREPRVRAWIREARGVPRFVEDRVPVYFEDRVPTRSASLRWPCACERCREGHGWSSRHCDERVVAPPRRGGAPPLQRRREQVDGNRGRRPLRRFPLRPVGGDHRWDALQVSGTGRAGGDGGGTAHAARPAPGDARDGNAAGETGRRQPPRTSSRTPPRRVGTGTPGAATARMPMETVVTICRCTSSVI